jgi:hypothetical protein
LQACENGGRIAALFGQPVGTDRVRLFAVLAHDADGQLTCVQPKCRRLSGADSGLRAGALVRARNRRAMGRSPEGHPWLKPIRFHHSYRAGHDAWNRAAEIPVPPGVTDFFTMTATNS